MNTCHFLSHLSSPSPRHYLGLCPHHHGFTVDFIPIPRTFFPIIPPYLADELCQPADTEARCCLRSASTSSLVVRRTWLSTVGDRAFPVAGPRIWNSLPQHVTSAPSLAIFRSRLKTPLFRRCFPWLHRSLVVPEKWHVITDTLIVFVTYLQWFAHWPLMDSTSFVRCTFGTARRGLGGLQPRPVPFSLYQM